MSEDPDADATVEAEPDPPPLLRENLHALVEGLVAADGLFVLLDFDGTLAAIEPRPDDASMPDSTREAVERLVDAPNVAVAVVSGRALDDVRERVEIQDGDSARERAGIAYAGNHGLEMYANGERIVNPVARRTQGTIAHLCDELTERLVGIPGAFVERKGVTATVHTRLVADDAKPHVSTIVESLAATYDDVRLTTGKDVLELRPDVAWDKGEAVRWLAEEVIPDDEEWFPVYLGDDTTDEAAFAALADRERGFGVKVGHHPPTAAPYRVSDPEAVRETLSWLATYGIEFIDADPTPSSAGAA